MSDLQSLIRRELRRRLTGSDDPDAPFPRGSIRAFGDGIGLGESWVSQYFNGTKRMTMDALEQCAAYFGVTPHALLGDAAAAPGHDEQTARLLSYWKQMDDRDRDILMATAKRAAVPAAPRAAATRSADETAPDR